MADVGGTVTNGTGADSSGSSPAGVGAGIAVGVAGTVILGVAATIAIILILRHAWRKEKEKAGATSAHSEQSTERRAQDMEFTATLYSGGARLKTDTREEYDPLAPGARSWYFARSAYNPGYDDKGIFLVEGQEVEVLGTNQYGWWWVKTTNNQTGIVEEGRVPASYLEILNSKAVTQPPVSETQSPVSETQSPVPETQPPVPETQSPVPETQTPAPETQTPAPETQPSIPEAQLPPTETQPTAPEINHATAPCEPSEN